MLDLVVAALAVLLVSIAVARRGAQQLSPGFLGLALVHMMSLSHALTDLVQHWAGLETSMGAIVRIRDFAENTPVDKPGPVAERGPLPEGWPAHGAVKFENLSATYGYVAFSHGASGLMSLGSIANEGVLQQPRHSACPQGRQLFRCCRPETWLGRKVRKVSGRVLLSSCPPILSFSDFDF